MSTRYRDDVQETLDWLLQTYPDLTRTLPLYADALQAMDPQCMADAVVAACRKVSTRPPTVLEIQQEYRTLAAERIRHQRFPPGGPQRLLDEVAPRMSAASQALWLVTRAWLRHGDRHRYAAELRDVAAQHPEVALAAIEQAQWVERRAGAHGAAGGSRLV